MKVFLYTPSLAMGGAEQQCCQLAVLLKVRLGCDVEVIVTHGNRSGERMVKTLADHQIPIHACSWKSISGLRKMYGLFKMSEPDSVLLCYQTFPDFIGGLMGWIAGLKKIYGGVRTECLPLFHVALDWLAQRLFLAGTIFNSHRAHHKFIVRYGFLPGKSFVITNFIQDCQIRHDYQRETDVVRVITVGTFKPPKDYQTWLKVIARARQESKMITGTIIGYGELESELVKWRRELSLEEAVEIIPGKGLQDIPERLAAADIYLNTSILEGTSNSILEGMRAGLPIVATRVGDNDRLIDDRKSGYLEEAKDVEALAADVLHLAASGEERKIFGAEALRITEERYSVDAVLEQYKKLLA